MLVLLRTLGVALAASLDAMPDESDFIRAIRANPRDSRAHSGYAIFLQQQGRMVEAIAHFRSALDLDAKSPTASFNLGLALLAADRPADALAVLDEYPARNGDWHALRGAILNALGRQPEAIRDLRTAVALDPANPDTLFDLIITLLRTEANAEAGKFVELGRSRFPSTGKIHAAAGALAYATGKNDQAVRAYETAVKLEPGAADFHASLGDVYDATNDLAKAESAYRRSIELDGAVSAVYVKFAKNQLKRQEAEEAERSLRRALALDPSGAEIHFQLGKIEAGRGNHSAATGHWEKAVSVNPTLKEAWYQLSLSYRRAGEPEKAERAAKEFRKLQ
jgi:tetratricopeptide (TPR) repeat protein